MSPETREIISTRMALVSKLKYVLISSLNLELEPDELSEESQLFGFGLGLDSIDALTLIVGIEDAFNVHIPEGIPHILRSVNTLADFLMGSEPHNALEQLSIMSAAPTGVDKDYEAIRTAVGITDFSAIGKFRIRGAAAMKRLDPLVAGNLDRLMENSIRWTAALDEAGRVIADLQVYNQFDTYLVTCAADCRGEVAELLKGIASDVEVEDVSDTLGAVAVEGPLAPDIPHAIIGMDGSGLGLLKFVEVDVFGRQVLLSRIGFTGEYGYIFFLEPEHIAPLVDRIVEVCPVARPCGTAVQDRLRLEMRAFSPKSHFLRDETALEAGLHWMIDFRKDEFRGRGAIMAEKATGLRQRLIGFTLEGSAVPLPGANVTDGVEKVGYVASAICSLTLEQPIGLAYLRNDYACVGVRLGVDGSYLQTVSTPFLTTQSTKTASQ